MKKLQIVAAAAAFLSLMEPAIGQRFLSIEANVSAPVQFVGQTELAHARIKSSVWPGAALSFCWAKPLGSGPFELDLKASVGAVVASIGQRADTVFTAASFDIHSNSNVNAKFLSFSPLLGVRLLNGPKRQLTALAGPRAAANFLIGTEQAYFSNLPGGQMKKLFETTSLSKSTMAVSADFGLRLSFLETRKWIKNVYLIGSWSPKKTIEGSYQIGDEAPSAAGSFFMRAQSIAFWASFKL